MDARIRLTVVDIWDQQQLGEYVRKISIGLQIV